MEDQQSSVRPDIRIKAIASAIPALNPGKDFTKGGKPEVTALEAILGFDITAAERDAAFKAAEASKADSGIVTMETVLKNMRAAGKKI